MAAVLASPGVSRAGLSAFTDNDAGEHAALMSPAGGAGVTCENSGLRVRRFCSEWESPFGACPAQRFKQNRACQKAQTISTINF